MTTFGTTAGIVLGIEILEFLPSNAKNNRLDVVKALLKGKADRSIKNKFGQTAFDLSFDTEVQNYLKNYK